MDTMNREKIAELTDKYYSEYKLHSFVDKFLRKYKWIPQKDRDDFYSVANYYFIEAANDFDGTGEFEGYLRMILAKKLSSYARGMRRKKRCDVRTVIVDGKKETVYLSTLSFDAPIENENGNTNETLGDITPSSFNLEDNLSDEIGLSYDDNVKRYLERLPKIQKSIVMLLVEGYKPSEIRVKLHITESEYSDHMIGIRASENISILL